MSILSQVGGGDRWLEKEMEKYGMTPKYLYKRKGDGEWEYNGNIVIDRENDIEEFPFYFYTVYGDILIYGHKLRSLKNFPHTIMGNLSLRYCDVLENLQYSPKVVHGSFRCINCNGLNSLTGSPNTLVGDFVCLNCKGLTTLRGCPRMVFGNFDMNGCENLESLEYGPEWVGKDYSIERCMKVKTLEGFNTKIGGYMEWKGGGLNINNTETIRILEENNVKYFR